MKRLIIFLLLSAAIKVAGQTTGYLRFDTVKIMKQNGTCELYIINKTKDSTGGVLTNIGGGLTSFRKTHVTGDTLFVGGDTVIVALSGKLDSVTIETAVTPLPDTLFEWRGATRTQVGLIPKGDATKNFIVGTAAPSALVGINGDYFWNRMKSHMYIKAAGSWGTPYGYLIADTLQPISTSFYNGPIIKLKEIWDTAAMSWAMPSIQRNFNVPGNAALDYKDDPVMLWGWNVDAGGNRIDNWKAMMLWHHESNYQTLPFTIEPWFESHVSVGFKPGTQGYNWGVGAERVESINASQYSYNIYKYNTKAREFWQWRIDSAQPHVTYFEINPDFARLLKKLAIDSIPVNDVWLQLDAVDIGTKMLAYGRHRYIFNRSGFADTTILRADVGDFVFLRNLGSGRTLFDLPVGIGLSSDDAFGRAPIQLSQTGEFYAHKYNNSLQNFSLNEHNSRYGMTLNATPSKKSYLHITNQDIGQDFNIDLSSNITVIDSISLPIRFNLEKSYLGSMTNALLIGTRGWEWNLNDIHRVNTVFTDSAASNGRRLADVVWSTVRTGGSTMTEMARLSHTGDFYLRFVDSTSTPANMAVFDPISGHLMKAAIPSAGTPSNITGLISEGSGIDITGTGTSGDPYVIAATGGGGGGVADPGANGVMVRTALNTTTARTLTGTSNRITITDGNGVSGNPTFDIGSDVVTLTGTQTLTNKTLTSPVINVGSDATGDIYYRSSGGAFTRLAAGTDGQVLTLASGLPSWAAGGGGGGTPGGSGSELQYRVNGTTFGGGAGTTWDNTNSGLTINKTALGVTQNNSAGYILSNTTAAAAGAQQISPGIHWLGNGWKTTATAASQPVAFRAYVLPVQGTTNPSATWTLESSINGGAYANGLTYTSGGVLTVVTSATIAGTSIGNSITANGSVSAASTGFLAFNTRTRFASPSDGVITVSNAAMTDFTRFQFGGTTNLFPALTRSTTKLIAQLADGSARTNFGVLNEAYDATSWNGNEDVPTKDAIRDKIESLSGATTLYSGDGTLAGNRQVSGATFNLSLGTGGSKLGTFTVSAGGNASIISDARLFLYGNITYFATNHNTDANLTVPANTGILELNTSALTTNRTITLPTATTQGQVITVVVRFASSGSHFVLNAATEDVKTGTTFTQLEWGTTYEFMVNASLAWMVIRKY